MRHLTNLKCYICEGKKSTPKSRILNTVEYKKLKMMAEEAGITVAIGL